MLASLQRQLGLGLALDTLQTQHNLLGGLGLLVEDGLGLTTVTGLLTVVSALSLGEQRGLTSLVLGDLVLGVLAALLALAVGVSRLGNVDLAAHSQSLEFHFHATQDRHAVMPAAAQNSLRLFRSWLTGCEVVAVDRPRAPSSPACSCSMLRLRHHSPPSHLWCRRGGVCSRKLFLRGRWCMCSCVEQHAMIHGGGIGFLVKTYHFDDVVWCRSFGCCGDEVPESERNLEVLMNSSFLWAMARVDASPESRLHVADSRSHTVAEHC